MPASRFSGSFADIGEGDYKVGLNLNIPLGDPGPQRNYRRAGIALEQASNESR